MKIKLTEGGVLHGTKGETRLFPKVKPPAPIPEIEKYKRNLYPYDKKDEAMERFSQKLIEGRSGWLNENRKEAELENLKEELITRVENLTKCPHYSKEQFGDVLNFLAMIYNFTWEV